MKQFNKIQQLLVFCFHFLELIFLRSILSVFIFYLLWSTVVLTCTKKETLIFKSQTFAFELELQCKFPSRVLVARTQ